MELTMDFIDNKYAHSGVHDLTSHIAVYRPTGCEKCGRPSASFLSEQAVAMHRKGQTPVDKQIEALGLQVRSKVYGIEPYNLTTENLERWSREGSYSQAM